MKRGDSFWPRWSALKVKLHTRLMRGRFASWGPGSQLEPPSKLVSPHLVSVGKGAHICEHAWLNAKDDRGDGKPTLRIGDSAYIGRFAHINAWRDVTIEDDVLIADRVFVSDCGHQYADPDLPIARQPDPFVGPVRLMRGCWIGVGAVILPGVTVGRNAVVAANAVVARDVPDRAVVGGVPARLIKRIDATPEAPGTP
jgi:acetyltransferase-like isoleucine patch superfamily enzyme